MQSKRETIYAALFALGAGIKDSANNPIFKTASRKWVTWANVAPDQQPAFYQIQRKEKVTTLERLGLPAKFELHVDWVIYVNSGADGSIIPAQLLNPITDQLVSLFEIGRVQNLGLPGIQEARIMDEDIVTDEGTLGDQAVIVIPIRVIAI